MERRAKPYDWNIAPLREEELVVLARECGWEPARQELFERCRRWTSRWVGQWARNGRLPPDEVPDAQQEALLMLPEALQRYDTMQLGKRSGRSFRSFLYEVVHDHLCNYVKRFWSKESHLDHSVDAADVIEGRAKKRQRIAGGPGLREDDPGDPVATAEEHESLERLTKALKQLQEPARELWRMRAAGMSLIAIADKWGIPLGSVKHRWRQLLADLTASLRTQKVGGGRKKRAEMRADRNEKPSA